MARLGDVCTVVSGTTPKTSNPDFWDGDLNWITPAELSEDTVVVCESKRKITLKGVQSCGLSPIPAGTVILSSRAPIGKTAIAGTEMYCNQGFKNLICSESIFNKYLFWFLRCNTEYLNSLGRGATFKEISKAIVEDIDIPLPDLPTQRCIAATLDKVSEGIALCKQIMADLDELVKSQFVEMFGNPVSNAMAWQMRPLKETCTLMTGNTPSRAEKEYYGSYIEWIKSDNITNSSLYLTTAAESLSEKGAEVGRIVHPGAILMTCIAGSLNTIGNVAIVDRDVAFNQQINAIIPHQYDTLFLCYLLKLLKPKLHEVASSALKCILNKGNLEAFTAIVPDIALQKEFSSFVAQSDKSKFAVQQQLMELETLKKSLMQEYFQ